MLAAAPDKEVNTFVGRDRYERSDEFGGYRNGYHRSRELTVGLSAVEVKVPRVSDVPKEVSPDGYSSRIVRRYERRSCSESCTWRVCRLETSTSVSGVGGRDGGAECERDRETEE